MKVTSIVKQLTYHHKNGYTLKELYDWLEKIYGIGKSPWVFSEFVKQNKHNEAFMNEFNSTSFTYQIIHVVKT